VRSDRVVPPTLLLDQRSCLLQRVEDLPVEQLVPMPTIEALAVPVLPRTSWLDEQWSDIKAIELLSDRLRAELRSVVQVDVLRWPLGEEHLRQHLDDISGLELPINQDGQTLPCVLVDYGQHAKRPSVVRPFHDEVVGPDVVQRTRSSH
jgi:hypothetical protein